MTFTLRGARPPSRFRAQPDTLHAYWALDPTEVMRRLDSGPTGLSSAEAARRLLQYGPNDLREQGQLSRARVLWNQLRSPLLLLLVFAAGASVLTGAWIDAAIVLTILVASIGIGYSREYRAQVAADKLRARVQAVATVLRDARPVTIPAREVVPGDVVLLAAGSLLPADAIVLESTDCFVNESVLTGESFPVEKTPGVVARRSVLTERTNCVFLGTNVRSGTARCLVVATGMATQFGTIAHRLTLRPPETEFDRGLRRFGYLLTSAMLVMVFVVFAANMFLGTPADRDVAVLHRAGRGTEPGAAARHPQRQSGARRAAAWRTTASSSGGSTRSRTSAAWTSCAPTRLARLTEGVVELEGAYDDKESGLTASWSSRAAMPRSRPGWPTRSTRPSCTLSKADLGGVEKLGEIPLRFRPQAA